ncbi:MAG: hypothetical protein BGN99_31150 [Alphaproteobacteria bacterium 65-37]|nr:hypothetical protein [Alphaproteobacteria bacterium]OJU46489.1 MAG: hypothetical protein BGN99_31150 [Alphaproteobacteria bacterium 65-37]
MTRFALSFCLAPVLPAIVKTLTVVDFSDRVSLSILWWIGGLLYLAQLAIAVPGYLYVRHLGHTGVNEHVFVGCLSVLLPGIAASVYWCAFTSCFGGSLLHAAYMSLYGCAMGAIFWLIARPDRHGPKA